MWLVLVIASLGWVFDIFEGQIFVASMKEAMPSLLPPGTLEGTVDFYNNIAMGAYLVGGAFGGVLFGMLSDRIGRTRTMILTILMYSLFTCVTAFAQTWWQMTILRFLVAMGTGGEWAVASAMVAEVFPKRARAWSLGIFHASSVLGTYLAVLAGVFVVGNPNWGWRWGFVLGAVPAVLTLFIRWLLREPEQWKQARDRAKTDSAQRTGRMVDLFAPDLLRNTLVGLILATVGLATFWGVHIYGRELLRTIVERPYLEESAPEIQLRVEEVREAVSILLANYQGDTVQRADILAALQSLPPASLETVEQTLPSQAEQIPRGELAAVPARVRKSMTATVLDALPDAEKRSIKNWEMLGMFLVTTGGGLGLLSFGPICEWIGRRATFLLFHVGGLASALIVFQVMADGSATALSWMLPVFGYLTLGMHAGYAIYFPELFPTRLRGTGGGFCFNGGRFLAASILIVRGWMRDDQGLGLSLESTASMLSLLFLVGMVVLLAAPETKGRELPT
jgi:MFS family permease